MLLSIQHCAVNAQKSSPRGSQIKTSGASILENPSKYGFSKISSDEKRFYFDDNGRRHEMSSRGGGKNLDISPKAITKKTVVLNKKGKSYKIWEESENPPPGYVKKQVIEKTVNLNKDGTGRAKSGSNFGGGGASSRMLRKNLGEPGHYGRRSGFNQGRGGYYGGGLGMHGLEKGFHGAGPGFRGARLGHGARPGLHGVGPGLHSVGPGLHGVGAGLRSVGPASLAVGHGFQPAFIPGPASHGTGRNFYSPGVRSNIHSSRPGSNGFISGFNGARSSANVPKSGLRDARSDFDVPRSRVNGARSRPMLNGFGGPRSVPASSGLNRGLRRGGPGFISEEIIRGRPNSYTSQSNLLGTRRLGPSNGRSILRHEEFGPGRRGTGSSSGRRGRGRSGLDNGGLRSVVSSRNRRLGGRRPDGVELTSSRISSGGGGGLITSNRVAGRRGTGAGLGSGNGGFSEEVITTSNVGSGGSKRAISNKAGSGGNGGSFVEEWSSSSGGSNGMGGLNANNAGSGGGESFSEEWSSSSNTGGSGGRSSQVIEQQFPIFEQMGVPKELNPRNMLTMFGG